MPNQEDVVARDDQFGPFQIVILALSVYVLVVLFVETFVTLPPDVSLILQRIDDVICLVFLADFVVRLTRAPDKKRFLKWGWIDVISSIPTVDALRWGRLVRVVRLFRILRAFRSTRVLVNFFYRKRGQGTFATVALISITITIFATVVILTLENVPEANIRTAGDALWWAFVTVTTVGYGDKYPVTAEGRLVAAVLMTVGVGLFGTFTALLASLFVEPDQKKESADLELVLAELKAIREELAELKAASGGSLRDPQSS